jgi:hypothetical protein
LPFFFSSFFFLFLFFFFSRRMANSKEEWERDLRVVKRLLSNPGDIVTALLSEPAAGADDPLEVQRKALRLLMLRTAQAHSETALTMRLRLARSLPNIAPHVAAIAAAQRSGSAYSASMVHVKNAAKLLDSVDTKTHILKARSATPDDVIQTFLLDELRPGHRFESVIKHSRAKRSPAGSTSVKDTGAGQSRPMGQDSVNSMLNKIRADSTKAFEELQKVLNDDGAIRAELQAVLAAEQALATIQCDVLRVENPGHPLTVADAERLREELGKSCGTRGLTLGAEAEAEALKPLVQRWLALGVVARRDATSSGGGGSVSAVPHCDALGPDTVLYEPCPDGRRVIAVSGFKVAGFYECDWMLVVVEPMASPVVGDGAGGAGAAAASAAAAADVSTAGPRAADAPDDAPNCKAQKQRHPSRQSKASAPPPPQWRAVRVLAIAEVKKNLIELDHASRQLRGAVGFLAHSKTKPLEHDAKSNSKRKKNCDRAGESDVQRHPTDAPDGTFIGTVFHNIMFGPEAFAGLPEERGPHTLVVAGPHCSSMSPGSRHTLRSYIADAPGAAVEAAIADTINVLDSRCGGSGRGCANCTVSASECIPDDAVATGSNAPGVEQIPQDIIERAAELAAEGVHHAAASIEVCRGEDPALIVVITDKDSPRWIEAMDAESPR